jgi:protein-L-isoaspartate(D-aspartate) O-methyltransferase
MSLSLYRMGDLELADELQRRGIEDRRVLAAIGSLSRRDFVPQEARQSAVGDHPLPIGYGQTISQPYIVAYMSEALQIEPGHRVLEIGTGSGYQAAVLAQMGAEVYSVEIVPELAQQARSVLEKLRLADRIHLRHADGAAGWPEAAPFQAVILTAAPPRIPEPLLEQLTVGGSLLAPVGYSAQAQELVRVTRLREGWVTERLLPVRFVPMTGVMQDAGGDARR